MFDPLTGSIVKSLWKCQAGEGPSANCKHVLAVMFGFMMFTKNKTIKTISWLSLKSQCFDMPGAGVSSSPRLFTKLSRL